MATLGGARALGLDALIGCVATGRRADLIVIRTEGPTWTPNLNRISNFVYASSGADVDTVMVDAEILIEGQGDDEARREPNPLGGARAGRRPVRPRWPGGSAGLASAMSDPFPRNRYLPYVTTNGVVALPKHQAAVVVVIAGKDIANPAGATWSAALMLVHLGHDQESRQVLAALEAISRDGPRTVDIAGSASTAEMGEAVAMRLSGVAA